MENCNENGLCVSKCLFTLCCVFFVYIDYNNISKFLNRILGIEVELQNKLFHFFTDTLNSIILEQKRRGVWDMGILGMCILHTTHVICFYFTCLVFHKLLQVCMDASLKLFRIIGAGFHRSTVLALRTAQCTDSNQ